MNLKNVFVTGSNRGIGLEIVRQLIKGHPAIGRARNVFACCRDRTKATDLQNIAKEATNGVKLYLVSLEVTDDKQISEAVKFVDPIVGEDGLNMIINNAAILERDGSILPSVTRTNLMNHLDVNVASPILITQAFLPLLCQAATGKNGDELSVFRSSVINISSPLGSIGTMGGSAGVGCGYRVSKAALNMATKCLAVDLKKENILFISISPGWVQTDMGTDKATWTPKESVTELFDTLVCFTKEHNGGFFERDGQPIDF